ncbi:hypothetical protein BH23ACT9_BH23ACT9_07550 [soil metagenome]
MSEVVIDDRFQGPVRHGNGGYVAGLLAASLGGAAAVRLRRMTPTGTPLRMEQDGAGIGLFDGDTLLVHAEEGAPQLDIPDPVDVGLVEEAMPRSPALTDRHAAPACFGCGPDRPAGQGLRIFAGPIEGTQLSGAVWTAPPDLIDGKGRTPVEVVWAALDCPGGWALAVAGVLGPGQFPALIHQTGELRAPVRPGEQLVSLAWPLPSDPARPEAGTAVYGPDGDVRAVAHLVHAVMDPNWAKG